MPVRPFVIGIVLTVALAACGSAAPATSTPAAATTPAGASGTPSAAASVSAPSDSTGPATSQGPLASFAGNPALLAGFPTQVAGKPVTNVKVLRLVDFFTAFQTPKTQIDQTRQSLATAGIDMDTVVIGLAEATVNGSPVGFEAISVPGLDGNKLIQEYALISPLKTGDAMKQETVAGKTVSVVRDSGGYASTWLYATGEIVWSVGTSDVKEATAIFAALP